MGESGKLGLLKKWILKILDTFKDIFEPFDSAITALRRATRLVGEGITWAFLGIALMAVGVAWALVATCSRAESQTNYGWAFVTTGGGLFAFAVVVVAMITRLFSDLKPIWNGTFGFSPVAGFAACLVGEQHMDGRGLVRRYLRRALKLIR
jgi:hypothetical protein